MMYISDEEKQKFPFNSSMDTENTQLFLSYHLILRENHIVLTIHQVTVSFGDIDGTGSEDELVFYITTLRNNEEICSYKQTQT